MEHSCPPGTFSSTMVENKDSEPTKVLLRQLNIIGGQAVLHALNGRYEDLLLSNRHRILGRAVRLRKNL
jgi:SOS-response transcriptional repressor LexA